MICARIQWAAVLVVILTAVVVGAGLSAAGSPAFGPNTPAERTGTASTSPPPQMVGNAVNTTVSTGATSWPMASVDAANTRHLGTTGLTKPMTERWQFKTKDERFTQQVVADGTIYFGGEDLSCTPSPVGKRNPDCREHEDHVYAVNTETGKERWRLSLGNASIKTPAVVNDTVYVSITAKTHTDGPSPEAVFALDAGTGTVLWRTEMRGGLSPPSPPIVVDGTVYVTIPTVESGTPSVYALDSSTGEISWTETTNLVFGGLAVADDTVYLGGVNGTVYALNAETGDRRWTAQAGDDLGTPTVAHGLVYVGSEDRNTMYALDAQTGDEQWKVPIESDAIVKGIQGAAVSGDTVYFGTAREKMYAVDAETGARRWSVRRPKNSPVLVDGIAYAAQGRTVYALNDENGNEVARFTVDDPEGRVNSGATVVDGSLYIAYNFESDSERYDNHNDTRLYALGSTAMSFSNLSISPQTVAPGEPVTVSATVTNTGTSSGTFNATLVVNGSVVSAGEASLDAGDQSTVEFTHVFRENGTYAIGINHLREEINVGSVEQTTSQPPETPTLEQPTPLNGTGNATGPGSGSSGNGTAPETATEESGPGFGVAVGGLALLVVGLLRRFKLRT